MIGPNLTSCHVKLILVKPLGSKTRKLGAFGSYIPTNCSKTWLERNVFQSQNSHLWNTECVKSVALEGGLIFRRSLAWDELLQPVCCCFELPCRARSFSDGSRASFAGLNTTYPEWKTAFFEGNQKKILSSPERIGFHSVATVWFSFHSLFWLLRKKRFQHGWQFCRLHDFKCDWNFSLLPPRYSRTWTVGLFYS